jgi:RND family efflux transporter MFP subunit
VQIAESENRIKITLRTKYYYLIGAIVLSSMVASCGNGSSGQGGPGGPGQWQNQGGQATSVEVVPVTTGSISDQIRSFGTIRAQDIVNVNPQVSNRITEIHVDLGDTVEQGQVMAKIYDVPFRDEFEQAQAQLRQSRSAFQRDSTMYVRQRQLFEAEAISSSEFDDAQATYESSRAQLEAAQAALTQSRENLANTEIRSPVYGVVLNRMISEGDLATTGNVAFEVANLVGYETRLHLPMQDWEEVTVGLPVEMRLSNRDGVAARGNVTRISPQLSPNTGLGEVVVSLTELTPSVRQGVLVDSRITLVTHENTIVIPRSALLEQVETYIEPETNTVELRRNYSVFVAQGDTIAVRREVELGLEQGERIEVLSGIEAGEQLIITGHRSLSNESRIRIAGQESSELRSFGESSGSGSTDAPRGRPGSDSGNQ